jgi:putative sigma-54 modulation protein
LVNLTICGFSVKNRGDDFLKTIITARKMELSTGLKNHIEKRLKKLDKFFPDDAVANVTASIEKERQTMEVTVKHKGLYFRAQETTSDLYISMDKVVDMLERQIRKNKTRLEKTLKAGAFTLDDPAAVPAEEDETYDIIKSKQFALKPMDLDEAILQMNLLGHQFFVFKNSQTNHVNVVYRRHDKNYGLIEPLEE